jgi:hypothetical protein
VAAVDVGIDRDLLAEADPGDALPDLVHHPDQLVSRDQREDGVEVALVDVQVGAAHADLVHLDAHLAGRGLRGGDLLDGVAAGGVVHDGLHGALLPNEDRFVTWLKRRLGHDTVVCHRCHRENPECSDTGDIPPVRCVSSWPGG